MKLGPLFFGASALVVGGYALASPRTLDLYEETMSLDAVPARGEKLYRQHCASCHGRRALGKADEVIPSLAGQIEPYLAKELVDFAELDRNAPEMHRVMARPELDEPQAWRDLAGYLAKLPADRKPQHGDGKDLERGARSYAGYCALCHGAQGEGTERGPTPAISSQHYGYLVLQLRSFDTDHRINVEAPILDHMAGLSREDMRSIADFMSRTPRVAPGAMVVHRAHAEDASHTDPYAALRDAFVAMRRKLQDYERIQRGETNVHAAAGSTPTPGIPAA